MRIADLADMAGVSTRTVRHYHRIGLLPEPARQSNGYRNYEVRDALRLVRIRRLVELGLSLDEARDALADDEGRDLREVLAELDEGLARQEQRIHQRRQRLAELLEHPEDLPLTADDTVSGDTSRLLADIGTAFPDSTTACKDREYLALLGNADSDAAAETVAAFRRAMNDPEQVARLGSLYRRFDELVDTAPDDQRVEELACELLEVLPEELAVGVDSVEPDAHPFGSAMLADLSPAQAEVARRMMRKARCGS